MQPVPAELARFEDLFKQLLRHTMGFVAMVPPGDGYQKVPITTLSMFLGKRTNTINISALIKHLLIAETHWFNVLRGMQASTTIPFPENSASLDAMADVTLASEYEDQIRRALDAFLDVGHEKLGFTVKFDDRSYSVAGFLWTIHAHHAYHLGQIDLILRQMDVYPPEFMQWQETKRVLG